MEEKDTSVCKPKMRFVGLSGKGLMDGEGSLTGRRRHRRADREVQKATFS